jgi:hypothetical protein
LEELPEEYDESAPVLSEVEGEDEEASDSVAPSVGEEVDAPASPPADAEPLYELSPPAAGVEAAESSVEGVSAEAAGLASAAPWPADEP